jgi:hypothetical protein
VEHITKWGWPNVLRLADQHVELLVTLDVGPRILSYRLHDGPNVLKVFADQVGTSGEPGWVGRGGHRLWTSPEDLTRTYAPDNGPVEVAPVAGGAKVGTHDTVHGVRKEMEITLLPVGGVRVLHRITNTGPAPATLAAWGLTVLAPGGVEFLPLPPKRPHPGAPENASSADDYAPNQSLILWPFTDLADPRWGFGSRFITLRQDPAASGPTKIGMVNPEGWAAYQVGGCLFVKYLPYVEGATYPDRGCNFETFTNADMLEMETLSPLGTLRPGEAVEHVETWRLFRLEELVRTEEDAVRLINPLARSSRRQ